MADGFTTRSRFQKQESGQHNNTWGTELNAAGGSDLLDFALDGWVTFTLSGTKTLTSVNGATDEARGRLLNISSGTGGTITIPSVEKWYLVRNNSTGNVIITTGGATNATIVTTDTALVFCDATNVYLLQSKSYVDAAILSAALSASIPSQSGNAGKALVTDGTTAAWSQVDPATGISNLAAGIAAFLATPSSANLRTVLSDETGSGGGLVFATGPTLTNPIVGTQSPNDNSTKAASTAYADAAVAAGVVGLWDTKGATDCSGNPNYPAASKGDQYFVSVAGKIGGASGTTVEVGDIYVAIADNAGGTQASVGSSWLVLQANLIGALLSANALSELSGVASTARTNIGAQATLVSGTNIKTVNGSSLVGSGDVTIAGWTQIGSTVNTTSGTTATFSSIAQTYNDLLLVFEGVSHNGAGSLSFRIELSDNGANWTSVAGLNPAAAPFASSDTVYGSIELPGYRMAAGRWAANLAALASNRTTDTTNATVASAPWRIAAGVAHIRISIASDAFDAGSIKLYGK